jgi:hypothetical protein
MTNSEWTHAQWREYFLEQLRLAKTDDERRAIRKHPYWYPIMYGASPETIKRIIDGDKTGG